MPAIIIIHMIIAAAARRSGATCVAINASSDVPAAPTPMPISVKARTASAMPAWVFVAIHAVARAALDAAGTEHRHAAYDPLRAAATLVRAIAETRAERLQCVVPSDQRARKNGGERELDHHDAVHGGGGEHDDRAERGLHQAEPGDADPAERRCCHAAPPPLPPSAKAVTSMPST